MKRTSTALALIMAVSAGPAFAQAQWTFTDIDQDNDLELSDREFEQVSRDTFEQLDADQDQALTEEELTAGSDLIVTQGEVEFEQWDTDADGTVDWADFHTGLFESYDADRDDAIGEQEFAGLQEVAPTERAALGVPEAGERAIQADQIIALSEWRYDDLYAGGFSVEDFIDEMEVYGAAGEDIGDVEDMIFSSDGRVLAVIAEVGGLWDIGDTHVSIPWDQVDLQAYADGISVPLLEENVGEYSLFEAGYLTAGEAGTAVVGEVDEAVTGPRAWRGSELIGDYARLDQADRYLNYGYVNDLIVRDGQVAAVVVEPDATFGARGPYAYPYYADGLRPGTPFYDLPYGRDEVANLEPFEEERLDQ